MPAPDRVCVIIARTRHKMIVVELDEAVKRGAKFIELRLDFLAKAVDFKRLLPVKKCPWIATLRRPEDGGRWPGTEQERQMVLRQAIVSGGFDWVDLETDVANAIPRFGPVKRLISYHNMHETPKDLEDIYANMLKQDGDIYKLAVMAQSAEDVARVLKLQRSAPKPTMAFSMGDIGFPSRFIALKYGAPFIYAAFNRERGVAPGLPSVEEFRTTYPVRAITPDTAIYGVLGDPVGHSLSPVLHNHMYRKLKVDALYLPFRVPRGQLPAAVRALDCVPVSGYSVTIPHKEAAADLATEADDTVQRAGAANTLVRQPNGGFAAFNTDYHASISSLRDHINTREHDGPPPQMNQLFALVLGSGGAARAVAHALHDAGVRVTISGRSYDKATALAEEVKCKVVDWHARHNVLPCDVLVNCTPVGMHPKVDETPVHHSFLKSGLTVFDTIYNPENTMLVREARERGCHIVTGVDMFVRQAARQIEMFTGKEPPIDQMRDLMRKAMSPVNRAIDEELDESDDDD